jgi:hypothetical protein
MSNIKWYLVRRWLYGVLAAVGALAIQQGWIDPETVPLILAVVLAAFNTRPPAVPGEPEDGGV